MKRRFFQIHLLTAVVGMIVFGGFLWVNLKVQSIDIVECTQSMSMDIIYMTHKRYFYMGWPAIVSDEFQRDPNWANLSVPPVVKMDASEVEALMPRRFAATMSGDEFRKLKQSETIHGKPVLTLEDLKQQAPQQAEDLPMEGRIPLPFRLPSWAVNFHERNIAINAAVAVAATLAVMLGVEWFLRRREAGRGTEAV